MKHKFLVFAFVLFSMFNSFADPPVEKGRVIFTSRCASCHQVNQQLVGPALAGVDQRRSIDWIISFVHSSQSVIKDGDKDAIALFEQFNKIPMPDHRDLSHEDIRSVVDFIKSEARSATTDAAPFAKPVKLHPGYMPLSIAENYPFFIVLILVVLMLVGALLALVKVKSLQRED